MESLKDDIEGINDKWRKNIRNHKILVDLALNNAIIKIDVRYC
jgi:hypothetical protein